MPRLSKTLSDLIAKKARWEQHLPQIDEALRTLKMPVGRKGAFIRHATVPGVLAEAGDFGSNPGNLRMFSYLPPGLKGKAPLVVVLHGCTQTAASIEHGTGWSTLARRHGFALLVPEQRRENNPNTCFSWFTPADTSRDQGEAQSIRQMIAKMVEEHKLDASRVFVTGLSAGGAMTSALLAVYPEVFAGGAIIAGLPFRAASGMQNAFDAMAGNFGGRLSGGSAVGQIGGIKFGGASQAWGELVREATPHKGPWPKVSIWHGSADGIVSPLNALALARQWCDVHGVSEQEPSVSSIEGHQRLSWRGSDGVPLVDLVMLEGLGHGVPLGLTMRGADAVGADGPYMFDIGVPSTEHIARGWQLSR